MKRIDVRKPVVLTFILLVGCATAPRSKSDAGICGSKLARRTTGQASCYEHRCAYLESHPELVVSFRLSLHKGVDADTNVPDTVQVENQGCVASFLTQQGARVVAGDNPFHDVVAVGHLKDVREAFSLAIVDSVEPGCVESCSHCDARSPGSDCDSDPFCHSVNAQQAELEGSCVRLGELRPVACINQDDPCEERNAQAKDRAGSCWHFWQADCPALTRTGWLFTECVPWTAPTCE
jgi:hypothetical protein